MGGHGVVWLWGQGGYRVTDLGGGEAVGWFTVGLVSYGMIAVELDGCGVSGHGVRWLLWSQGGI